MPSTRRREEGGVLGPGLGGADTEMPKFACIDVTLKRLKSHLSQTQESEFNIFLNFEGLPRAQLRLHRAYTVRPQNDSCELED